MKKISFNIQIYTCVMFYLFFSHSAYSRTILTCLGKEELSLHKAKSTGSIYKLNQLFIEKFSGFDNILIKESALDKICIIPKGITETSGASYNLLTQLLLKGSSLFRFDKIKGNAATVSYIKNNLKSFADKTSIYIFFDYLSSLNSLLNNAHCLDIEIPEIKFFRDRFRYLESNYPIRKLVNDQRKLMKIIRGLRSFKEIQRRCLKK